MTYNSGNIIKLFTARGALLVRIGPLTKKQLSNWGILYHELILGKPEADYFIDDKACNDQYWLWEENNFNLKILVKTFWKAAVSFSHLSKDSSTLKKIDNLGNLVGILWKMEVLFYSWKWSFLK